MPEPNLKRRLEQHHLEFTLKKPNTSMSFEQHDVCLVVAGRRFYANKAHLAQHSEALGNMFFSHFAEKEKAEIVLEGIDNSDDFENFLKTINGVQCLTDDNIHGVLALADQWLCEAAQYECQKFLLFSSKLPPKDKFSLSVKYTFLEYLKDDLLAKTPNQNELKELVDGSIDEMNETTLRSVLRESFERIPSEPQPVLPTIPNRFVLEANRQNISGLRRRSPSPDLTIRARRSQAPPGRVRFYRGSSPPYD